ncbi:hypothetical protein [Alkalitalea saponilacus]|uniref:Uncharacterized protein n=1 Tax=Alkalitalea saponilacus TaxID=889453 RepID=A0A1T5E8V2_9BACT|nr:hypothetical protein [Alkalitalea saponilacus]ASB49073.1 hypothetical protein CDL62_07940 [Alkalitalea saponilacus]SKB80482.1 hypothetical protein SAMN03080601_01244 [Alkalitalea saponilacus]
MKTAKIIHAVLKLKLWSLSLLFLIFSACSSDGDKDEDIFFIRFNADGTKVEFTNQLILTAGFGQSGQFHTATISGANDAITNVGLQIYHDSPIIEGIYSGYGVTNDVVTGVILHYSAPTGILYSSGGVDVYAQVEITGLSQSVVTGKFSGVLKADEQSDLIVTDGEFRVRRIN